MNQQEILTLGEYDFVCYVLQNNAAAIDLATSLFSISQIWDDLVDGDVVVAPSKINSMMWLALVKVPSNEFYRTYFDALQPLLRQGIVDWWVANAIEAQAHPSDHLLNLSFVLRDNIYGILSQMALLIGGYQWMIDVSVLIRLYAHNEPLSKYKATIVPAKEVADVDEVLHPSEN